MAPVETVPPVSETWPPHPANAKTTVVVNTKRLLCFMACPSCAKGSTGIQLDPVTLRWQAQDFREATTPDSAPGYPNEQGQLGRRPLADMCRSIPIRMAI
jgi:hypothetical protein